MKALFDADIIVFRAAFAAEKNQWFLSVGGEPPETYAYKKDAMSRLDELLPGKYTREEGKDYQLWSERYCEPVENALHNAKTMVESALATLKLTEFDATMYLSGGKNFRHDIAKTRPYKANRDNAVRPTHEEAVRNYLKSKWSTTVVDGIEADDALGIAQTKAGAGSIIISIDKDLDMIPGKHYNFVADVQYEVTPELAWRTFCKQLLTGDTTDNIPGLTGIGAGKAEKILSALPQEDWLEEVARQYASRSTQEDWFAYLTEQAKLIWILRHPTDPEVDQMLEGFKHLGGDTDGTVETDLFS